MTATQECGTTVSLSMENVQRKEEINICHKHSENRYYLLGDYFCLIASDAFVLFLI